MMLEPPSFKNSSLQGGGQVRSKDTKRESTDFCGQRVATQCLAGLLWTLVPHWDLPCDLSTHGDTLSRILTPRPRVSTVARADSKVHTLVWGGGGACRPGAMSLLGERLGLGLS